MFNDWFLAAGHLSDVGTEETHHGVLETIVPGTTIVLEKIGGIVMDIRTTEIHVARG